MASKKQYAFIALVALWGAASGFGGGVGGGSVGMVAGAIGGTAAGVLLGAVLVALYNSRGEDEVLTVEDVQ